MDMTTNYRRRQYRDRRTFAKSDLVADLKIMVNLALALTFLALLLLVLFLGQPFINALFGG